MNKKISELVAASAVLSADNLVINQNGQTKKVSINNLFGGIPVPVNLKGKFLFGATPDLVNTGTPSLDITVTQLNLDGNNNVTLGLGAEGQIKIFVAVVGTGTSVINQNIYNLTITFSRIGDSATLLFTNGKWAFIGGTAAVENSV